MSELNENKFFKKYLKKASSYLGNKEKSTNLLKKAAKLAPDKKGALGEAWGKVNLFIDLFKSYINGSYRDISTKSILTVIGALIYFVSPIDAIPDFIVGLGFLDDATILAYTFKQINKDIEKYKIWKENNNEKDDLINLVEIEESEQDHELKD
ncbi:YkvA family protein [Bacillus sp. AFS088145]|uniref:YkvA family protein n=1 Tax=Bacillus sp. AFS088145 TaxID=2033514 RepID=UPI000BF38A0A|nr:YkvA family protein [Bacillus sp. AFS088145]PFH82598.1 methyltransferase type 11 [Bacillus sp. AFS088145]